MVVFPVRAPQALTVVDLALCCVGLLLLLLLLLLLPLSSLFRQFPFLLPV
jgi:hypothetical protein